MSFGIITYLAVDGSHGYLTELKNFNEIKQAVSKRNNGILIRLDKNNPLALKKHQIVCFNEKLDRHQRTYAEISRTSVYAITERLEHEFYNLHFVDDQGRNYILPRQKLPVVYPIIATELYVTGYRSDHVEFANFLDIKEIENFAYDIDEFIQMSKSCDLKDHQLNYQMLHFILTKISKQQTLEQIFEKTLSVLLETIESEQPLQYLNYLNYWLKQYPEVLKSVLTAYTHFPIFLEIIGQFEKNDVLNFNLSLQQWQFIEKQAWALQKKILQQLMDVIHPKTYESYLKKMLEIWASHAIERDLITFKAQYDFIAEFSSDLSNYFLEVLKQKRLGIELYWLWKNKYLVDCSSIDMLTLNLDDFSEVEKLDLLNGLPLSNALSIVNSIDFSTFTTRKVNTLSQLIQRALFEQTVVVFDLESDRENIFELAYQTQNKIHSAETKRKLTHLLQEFETLIQTQDVVLAGHNIGKFDLPILAKHIQLSEKQQLDTLTLELLLCSTRPSYALQTEHHAKQDVKQTVNLLINQTLRVLHLSHEQYQSIVKFLPLKFKNILQHLRACLDLTPYSELGSYLFKESHQYFRQSTITQFKNAELWQELATSKKPYILVVPPELRHQFSHLNVHFSADFSLAMCSLSQDKIRDLKLNDFLHTVLNNFLAQWQNPLARYQDLPTYVKNLLKKENIEIEHLVSSENIQLDTGLNYCLTQDDVVQLLDEIQKNDYLIYLIDQELLDLSQKTLLHTFKNNDFYQYEDAQKLWIKFSGGQSYLSLQPQQLKDLEVIASPIYESFWLEKTSFNELKVWANYNFKKIIQEHLKKSQIKEKSLLKDAKQAQCYYAVPQEKSLEMTRFNPETRYRNRYWIYQIKLIEKIIQNNLAKPVIWVLSSALDQNRNEKQIITDYLLHANYYIPDHRAMFTRQVELLQESRQQKKLMIIDENQLHQLFTLTQVSDCQIVLDHFALQEKWLIALGTGYLKRNSHKEDGLKSKYSVSEIENTSQIEPISIQSQNDLQDNFTLLKLQQPNIDYYRKLLHLTLPQSALWLLDSRLNDFYGLAEAWEIADVKLPLWLNAQSYEDDYQQLQKIAPSVDPLHDWKIDVAKSKEILRGVFLKKNALENHAWYDYQEDFLNEILPAQKNILVNLPTGGGKSLLFQAPALYRGSITGKLSIVITPLKALMEDQTTKLWELGFYGSVDYINSDRQDIQNIYRRIVSGELLLLYITPERFRSRRFMQALKMRINNDAGLEYAIYDEAHCVSQWGLDFRPDYLNSARSNQLLQERLSVEFPTLLFSATVSEQIYNDFQQHFNQSITKIKNEKVYKPTQPHIAMQFKSCVSAEDKLEQIVENLKQQNFNPKLSRCLIFVGRRKDAEDNVELLKQKLQDKFNHAIGVGYFHAGMGSEQRHETYTDYKDGKISILFATKAFGMGMDIPNIHYLYHYTPASTLEDFLQEIGRAGRNEEQRKHLNFDQNNPIQAQCFIEDADFGKIKDRLQTSQLTWNNVVIVYQAITEYYLKFRAIPNENASTPIVLPFNFLNRVPQFSNVKHSEGILRLSLYWLEKAKRIKLGYYAPSQLEFSAISLEKSVKLNSKELKLFKKLQVLWEKRRAENTALAVEINTLFDDEIQSSAEILKIIFQLQKKELICYDSQIMMYGTAKKEAEINANLPTDKFYRYPTVAAVFELAQKLMLNSKLKDQQVYTHEYLKPVIHDICTEAFNAGTLPWLAEYDEVNQTLTEKAFKAINNEEKEFIQSKAKFAFSLIGFIPKVRYKSLVDDQQGIKQIIYNGCKRSEDWKRFLVSFQKDLIHLIEYVRDNPPQQKTYNATDLILTLGFETKNISDIEQLFIFAKWLGYLHYEGSMIPMGVEFSLLKDQNLAEMTDELDQQVFKEFGETQKLRKLRLLALECLSLFDKDSNLDASQAKIEKDKFIQAYFTCDNTSSIENLMVNYLGEDHELVQAFRQEKLIQAYDDLKDDQKAVYDAPLDQNLQIIAGPGTGKTHTLILRIVRLIHKEGISPDNILVLAYNRAVVIELKQRLHQLLNQLGYAKIAYRIQIYTFHGLCKRFLKDELKKFDVNLWVKETLKLVQNNSHKFIPQLEQFKYIFVDEFQDITQERLNFLKLIAQPQQNYITVIGDPNQSIYGYERIDNLEKQRSSQPNYEAFAEIYAPKLLYLKHNFRSYPQILTAAETLLNYSSEKFGINDLIPVKQPTFANAYVDIISDENNDTTWLSQVEKLVEEIHPETQQPYQQIALLFRNNAQLQEALSQIEQLKQDRQWQIKINVQGTDIQFTKIREIACFIQHYKAMIQNQPNTMIGNFIQTVQDFRKNVIDKKYPNWDQDYLDQFECLVHEFSTGCDNNATYEDFIDFIEQDIGNATDGQILKMYRKHIVKVNPKQANVRKILLSTIHKVKGLEFDAVLVMASFESLPRKIKKMPHVLHEIFNRYNEFASDIRYARSKLNKEHSIDKYHEFIDRKIAERNITITRSQDKNTLEVYYYFECLFYEFFDLYEEDKYLITNFSEFITSKQNVEALNNVYYKHCQKSKFFQELRNEEMRLLYVAYTRAKYRLIAYQGEREQALIQGQAYCNTQTVMNRLSLKLGIDKYQISWAAQDNEWLLPFDDIEKLQYGQYLTLERQQNYWYVMLGNRKIARFKHGFSIPSNYHQHRLKLSYLHLFSYEESEKSDEKKGTNYSTTWWSESAKNRGYIYLPEFF